MMKKWAIYVLVIIILSLTVVQAYGQTVDDLRKQQKNVKLQIDKTKNEIQEIKNRTKDVSKEIEELDIKMDNAATELQRVEDTLTELNGQIEKTLLELEEAEIKLADQEEIFNKRLRAMYMNGNSGYIEVLLASTDITDFLSRKDMIQEIAEYDKELIAFMKEQRDIIDAKKMELEAQRASVEVTKAKLEARKRDLERVSREKEALMVRLVADKEAYEKEYDKLNQYAKDIESKIFKLQVVKSPYTGGKMAWPVPGYSRITSNFGYRIHPIFKVKKLHTGIDIGAPSGVAVTAASDGTVVHVGTLGGYGKTVMVDHGGGIITLYAHNSSYVASVGQKVKRGATISKIGSTGNSTGPHLHFEVRKNGAYVDPIPWLKGN